MNVRQPSQLNLAVYPVGESRPVIDFERLVALLSQEKLIYLNAVVASRLAETGIKTTENPNA